VLLSENQNFGKVIRFFYNGYICYTLSYPDRDTREVQFWLGRDLIERIEFTRQFLDEWVPNYCDAMPFVWELFLLARGEQEVVIYQERNNKYPASFEITRIENPLKVEIHEMRNQLINRQVFKESIEKGFVKVG